MKGFWGFIRTTLVGGIIIVLPIWLSILILAGLLSHLEKMVHPLSAVLPGVVNHPFIIATILFLAICFLTGLFVNTKSGLKIKNYLEHHILEHIPLYPIVRGITAQIAS